MGIKQPICRIVIDGIDIESLGYQGLINSIYIESDDEMADLAIVKLNNMEKMLTSASLFETGKEMEIWLGYKGKLEKAGKFILDKPRLTIQEYGLNQVVLRGYSEDILMSDEQKRKIWNDIKDSDIASKIAGDYGFKTDIEDTGTKYPQVSQMGESDILFLKRRAKLYGYKSYVRDGTLYFKPLKYDDTGLRLSYDLNSTKNMVKDFRVKSIVFHGATKLQQTNIDKLKKEIINETSENKLDEISAAIKTGRQSATDMKYRNLSPQKIRYVEEEGHLINREEIKKQVEKFAQSAMWIVEADSIVSPAIPTARARRIIEYIGIDHLSGKYYIKNVQHTFEADTLAFKTRLYLKSSFVGERIAPKVLNLNLMSGGTMNPSLIKQKDTITTDKMESTSLINDLPVNESRGTNTGGKIGTDKL